MPPYQTISISSLNCGQSTQALLAPLVLSRYHASQRVLGQFHLFRQSQRRQRGAHIRRNWRTDCGCGARRGMAESQLPGVQQRSPDARRQRRLARPAIERVARQWRSQVRQVRANLVRPSGQWLDQRQREAVARRENAIARVSWLARLSDDDAAPVGGIAAEWRENLALVGQRAHHDRQVALDDAPLLELTHQRPPRSLAPREQHDARCLAIQPVQQPRPGVATARGIGENEVGERAIQMAVRGMGHHASGLCHRQQVIILGEESDALRRQYGSRLYCIGRGEISVSQCPPPYLRSTSERLTP